MTAGTAAAAGDPLSTPRKIHGLVLHAQQRLLQGDEPRRHSSGGEAQHQRIPRDQQRRRECPIGAHRRRAKSRHRWNHNGRGDRRFGGRPFEARQSPENSGGQQPYESGMEHALGYRRPLCGLSRSRERHRDAGSYSAGLREARGKGNVVYIEGILGYPVEAERGHGFDLALKEYPGANLAARRPGGWSRTTTASVIADILTAHPDIDAVIVSNDDSAIAVVSALEQHKMKALVSGRDAIKE